MAAIKNEPLRILPLGDSLTQGSEDFPGGYRGVLENLLSERAVAFTFVGSKTTNSAGMRSPWHEGHPGFRIAHLRTGFSNDYSSCDSISEILARHRPDCVLLLAGTNNLYFDDPCEAWKELAALVRSIQDGSPGTAILLGTLLPIRPGPKPWGSVIPADVESRVAAFNGKIRAGGPELGLSDSRGGVVDLHGCMWSPTDFLADGVHPSPVAMTRIAEAWAREALRLAR